MRDPACPSHPGHGRVPVVILVEGLLRDAAEELAREDAQEAPGEVQRFEDGALLVALVDELALELVQKLEVQEILPAQRLRPTTAFIARVSFLMA